MCISWKNRDLLLQQARSDLEKAFELNPKDIKTLYELGRLMQDNGEINNAIDKFEKIINQESEEENNKITFARSYLNLAVLYDEIAKNTKENDKKLIYCEKIKTYYDETLKKYGIIDKTYLENKNNDPEFQAVKLSVCYVP